MFNILTDILPKEYQGYLINWQYYNGILIDQCLRDREELFTNDNQGKIEKIYTAFTILYGNGIPEFNKAFEGLKWFMSCGAENNNDDKSTQEYFCFSRDSGLIYSAFRVKYNLNLSEEKNLHWFEFLYLFNDLSKTAFREIVNIRLMKPSEYKHYSKEAKREIIRQKEKFYSNSKKDKYISEEENKLIDEFYSSLNPKTR